MIDQALCCCRRNAAHVAFAVGASEFETLDGESGWTALRTVAESGRCMILVFCLRAAQCSSLQYSMARVARPRCAPSQSLASVTLRTSVVLCLCAGQ